MDSHIFPIIVSSFLDIPGDLTTGGMTEETPHILTPGSNCNVCLGAEVALACFDGTDCVEVSRQMRAITMGMWGEM